MADEIKSEPDTPPDRATRHGDADCSLPKAAAVAEWSRRALLDAHTPPAATVDRDGRVVCYHGDVGPFLRTAGEPTGELLLLVREGLRGAVRAALQGAAENARATVTDGWVERESGRRHRVAVTASPVADPDAGDRPAAHFVVSFNDHGEDPAPGRAGWDAEVRRLRAEDALRASEERQRFLLRLSDALRPLTDPVAVQATAMELLAGRLGVMRAGYFELEEDGDTFRLAARFERGATPMPERMRLSDLSPALGDAYRRGRTLSVPDTGAGGEFGPDPGAYAAIGARAWAAVPLLREGRLAAWVGVHSGTPREWTAADLRVLDDVAERTWGAVERARAEAEAADARLRFERIAAATPGLLYLFDLQAGRNVYVNDGVERVLGYTPRQIAALGADFLPSLIHPDDLPGIEAGNRGYDALADGAVHEHEYRMRHADGSWRRVRSRDAVFARTPDGRAHQILGVAEDVTERRAAEEELQRSRQLLGLVAELGSDWWFTARVEADGTAVTESLSPMFTRQLGYTPDELMAAGGWAALVHPDDAAEAGRQYARLMAGEAIEGELRHVAKGGRVIWHQYRTQPQADAAGRVVRLVGASRDITARKRAEDKLRASEARLRAVAANLPNGAAFLVGPDLRYALAEGHGLRDAGFVPADFEGRTLAEVLPPDLAAEYEPRYRTALAGEPFRVEHAAHGRVFVTHGVPLRDADGRVTAALAVSYDLTDLRRAEGRLRRALAAARMGVWTLDVESGAQMRDGNLNALLGLPAADTTQPFDEFLTHVHPDDRAAVRGAFAASARERRPLNVEFRVVRPDGGVRWLRDQGDVFGESAAGGRHMAGACVDVTERQEAELALRASEERQRLILESATDFAILTLAPDRTVTSWSPGAEAVFGYAAGEVVGWSGDVLFTPEDRAAGEPEREAEEARRAGRAADERWHVRKDGTRFYASGAVRPLRDGGGFVKVARDLTGRKRMEDALREARDRLEERVAERTAELAAEAARRRELARRLGTAQEDERRRVARDLHDTVGQLLTGLSLAFKAIETGGDLPAPVAAKLAGAQRIMNDLGRELHGLAVRLRPTSLDDIGLESALGQLVSEWSARTGVRADVHASGAEPGRLPAEVETAVYRVAQEALTNVAKHARATLVSVVVTRPGGAVAVVVEDDGVGFDPDAAPKGRLGLLGMRERVGLVGGTVDVESRPGAGTTVAVQIPVPKPD